LALPMWPRRFAASLREMSPALPVNTTMAMKMAVRTVLISDRPRFRSADQRDTGANQYNTNPAGRGDDLAQHEVAEHSDTGIADGTDRLYKTEVRPGEQQEIRNKENH